MDPLICLWRSFSRCKALAGVTAKLPLLAALGRLGTSLQCSLACLSVERICSTAECTEAALHVTKYSQHHEAQHTESKTLPVPLISHLKHFAGWQVNACSGICPWSACSHILVRPEFQVHIGGWGAACSIGRHAPVHRLSSGTGDIIPASYHCQQDLGLLHVQGGAQTGVGAHAKGSQCLRSRRSVSWPSCVASPSESAFRSQSSA